jgi:hypothetical protein
VGNEGIYLVAYFPQDLWDPADKYRQRHAARHSLASLRQALADEAAARLIVAERCTCVSLKSLWEMTTTDNSPGEEQHYLSPKAPPSKSMPAGIVRSGGELPPPRNRG